MLKCARFCACYVCLFFSFVLRLRVFCLFSFLHVFVFLVCFCLLAFLFCMFWSAFVCSCSYLFVLFLSLFFSASIYLSVCRHLSYFLSLVGCLLPCLFWWPGKSGANLPVCLARSSPRLPSPTLRSAPKGAGACAGLASATPSGGPGRRGPCYLIEAQPKFYGNMSVQHTLFDPSDPRVQHQNKKVSIYQYIICRRCRLVCLMERCPSLSQSVCACVCSVGLIIVIIIHIYIYNKI